MCRPPAEAPSLRVLHLEPPEAIEVKCWRRRWWRWLWQLLLCWQLLLWLLLSWLLLLLLSLRTRGAAWMPRSGDVPVLNQRGLRGRRKQSMHGCCATWHWDKGSCAAHCVTEKVGATCCRARPDAAVRRVRRCIPLRCRWLHLNELSPGCWQGSQKDGHALPHRPIRMLRAAREIAQVADPDEAKPGPVLPSKGLHVCTCELPVEEQGLTHDCFVAERFRRM